MDPERKHWFLLYLISGELVGRLHKGGLIHGDITTSNILVAEDSQLVLIDFGLRLLVFSNMFRLRNLHIATVRSRPNKWQHCNTVSLSPPAPFDVLGIENYLSWFVYIVSEFKQIGNCSAAA